MPQLFAVAAAIAALALPYAPSRALAQAPAQTPEQTPAPSCLGDGALSGTIRDTTAALIPGASLTLDGTLSAVTDSAGRFRLPCVAPGRHTLTATADGFAPRTLAVTAPHPGPTDLTLPPETVETIETVTADDTAASSPNSTGLATTISGKLLQSLADDPDDLLRELQQLAATAGGNPSSTTISVDGFQESTSLPPKNSIAYIKVNPDMYSAEYREPPFDGGRIEIYTKPGQKTFHGALFATNGSPFENARDPFSTSKAALGKQRYGFELSGPVRPRVRHGEGADFALNLEHRSIDNFAVVDATTVDPISGSLIPIDQNVPTPQRLWIGLARVDWQLGPRNTFIASYAANVSQLTNVGVGGANLAESGYDSQKYDHMIRFSDVTTLNAHLMHEARLSLHLTRESFLPASTAPQVSVAGAFTGGGNSLGAQQRNWFTTEYDDDLILTTHVHTLKFGAFLTNYDEHRQLPTYFNGAYNFGGGYLPGSTTPITGIQQYQRALAGLPGGAPTTFASVTGSPTVNFNQLYAAFFFQDDWNAGHNLHISYGLRYFTQTAPTTFASTTPRLGVLWSPSKKNTWTLHAHTGLFSSNIGDGSEPEILREDGIHRITSTLYTPTCSIAAAFNPATCNPTGTAIYSLRQYSPHITQGLYSIQDIGGTRAFHGFNLSADFYYGRIWNMIRTQNINSPLNGSPTGPRALGIANTNILQAQNSSQGSGNVIFLGVENHSIKRLTFFLGIVRNVLIDDSDNSYTFTAQSAFTNAGEVAHRSNQGVWQVFGNASLTLPKKLQLSSDFHASGDSHYNITTGFDNNGDGDFNDRPQYAPAGATAATPGVYATRYGLLSSTGIPGISTGAFLPRNVGVMPWTIYLDTNLQRAFALNSPKSDHPQAITLNLRSSNVLNHLNVTSVGGILGSPQFGIPFAADNGRRIEAGLRYAF